MSHRCPVCECTVYGGDHIDRVCWTCENVEPGTGISVWFLLCAIVAFVAALVRS